MIRRPVCVEDTDALVRLFRSADVAEIGRAETSRADIADLLAAPGLDLARRSQVAIDEGDIHGLVLLHPAPQPGQLRVQLRVDSREGGGEVARMLLALVDQWILQGAETKPVEATVFQLPQALAVPQLVASGWTIVHSYTRMKADLTRFSEAPTTGEAVIRPASSEAEMATVHAVLEEANDGHWNHQRQSFDDFLSDQQHRDGHDPSLWLLAFVADQPAAALIARAPADRAWIAWLGTLPQYRGKGLATALLTTAFTELHKRGHSSVGVDVDTHNETHAGDVYQRAGMTILGTADQWRKTYC
ncbi:GNAT family N-acetyltransferase [Kribbella sp. NBC_01510]|uniref:GNAT family N-acetyltransferase n=1 Tax=Kribbella sp. NBC_01510 TaxID=2903581 RepID=UPI0038642EA1